MGITGLGTGCLRVMGIIIIIIINFVMILDAEPASQPASQPSFFPKAGEEVGR